MSDSDTAILFLVLALVHFAVFGGLFRCRPVHPMGAFPVLYLAWFAVGAYPIIELPSNLFFGLLSALESPMLVPVLVGYVAYLVGALGALWGTTRFAERAPAVAGRIDERRARHFLIALMAVFSLAMLALFALIGIPVLSAEVGLARLAVADHTKLLALCVITGWTVLTFLAVAHFSDRMSVPGGTRGAALMSGIVLLSFAALGSRGFVIEPLLVVLCVYGIERSSVTWRQIATFGAIGFLLVSLAGYLRDRSITSGGFDLLIDAGIPAAALPLVYVYLYIRQTVAVLGQLMAVVPVAAPYTNGSLTAAPLLTLLPGHRPAPDEVFRNLLGYEFEGGGLPATLLGPLYLDGGLTGIAIGLLIFGIVSALLYRAAQRYRAWMLSSLLYAWVWHLGVFGLYANLLPYLHAIAIPFVYVVMAAFVCRVRQADVLSRKVMQHAT